MAKELHFSENQFAIFAPYTKREIKKIVYRRDFQNGVIAIRKKYKITAPRKLKEEQGVSVYKQILEDDFPMEEKIAIENDVINLCNSLHVNREDWRMCFFAYVVYDIFTSRSLVEVDTPLMPTKEMLDNLDEKYEARLLLDAEEAPWAAGELTLYHSNNLHVQTDDGSIVMHISPQASPKEIRSTLKVIKKVQEHFNEQEINHGDEQLDTLNNMLYLHDVEKVIARHIPDRLRENYMLLLVEKGVPIEKAKNAAKNRFRYEESSVRSMLRRARKLGF